MKPVRPRLLFLLLTLLLPACDPLLGPQGTISLASGVTPVGASLEVRALFTTGAAFDPSAPVGGDGQSFALAGLAFPVSYDLVTIGETPQPHGRVIAFVTSSAGVGSISPGDWYGARDFEEGACGPLPDGSYCGPEEVDLVIDHRR